MPYAIRSKTQTPFRRSGVTFLPDSWRQVDDPTDAQLNEPMLEVVEFTNRKAPDLARFPFLEETDSPAPEEEPDRSADLDPEAVNRYVEDQGGVIVLQSDLDELKGKADRLEKQLSDVDGDLHAEKQRRTDDKQKHDDALAKLRDDHQKAIEGLNSKHKADLDKLRAELAEAKKGR
jgi:polyhydroxyalkanoate synthesis regulator phasin